MEDVVEKVYDNTFTRYVSNSSTLRSEVWATKPLLGIRGVDCKILIRNLLKEGYTVKGGYSGSSIRGIRRRYLFYKTGKARGPR